MHCLTVLLNHATLERTWLSKLAAKSTVASLMMIVSLEQEPSLDRVPVLSVVQLFFPTL